MGVAERDTFQASEAVVWVVQQHSLFFRVRFLRLRGAEHHRAFNCLQV